MNSLAYSSVSLDELLADPLIQLVMRADKVDAALIRALVQTVGEDRYPNSGADHAAPQVSIHPEESGRYRSGVGIMLFNKKKEILLGRRVGGEEAWQMPQGGIENDETPYQTTLRELREEIGTDRVHLLAVSKGWLRYDVPSALRPRSWNARWLGQQQKWFALYFYGDDQDINVATEHPEFEDWRWASPAEAVTHIVDFKRPVYQNLLEEFKDLGDIQAEGSCK